MKVPVFWTEILGILREIRLVLKEKRRSWRHQREATGGTSGYSARAIERALKDVESAANEYSDLVKQFNAEDCVKAESELTKASQTKEPTTSEPPPAVSSEVTTDASP